MPIWILFLYAIGAPPQSANKLAVMSAEVKGQIDPAVVAALEDAIATEASRTSTMQVVSPSSVRLALSLQERQMLAGCSGGECFKQAATMLAADRMLTIGLQKLPNAYSLSLELVDLAAGRSQKRSSQQTELNPEALLKLARSQVAGMFGALAKLSLWNQPLGAEVLVDGKLIGPTPVGVITFDSPGKHSIAMQGPAVTTWRADVDAQVGTDLRLRAGSQPFSELEQRAHLRRNWAYGLGGGALVAAGGSAALWFAAVQNDKQLDRINLRSASQTQLDGITSRTTTLAVAAIATSAVTATLFSLSLWLFLDNPEARELNANGIAVW